MKYFVLSALFVAAAPSVFAEPVYLELQSLKSGYVSGVGKIEIAPEENGKLRLLHDDNVCSGGEPMLCTKKAVMSIVVEPKVIKDSRPADGDLVLELTPEIRLAVGSGYNLTGMISYTAVVSKAGSDEPIGVPLAPQVFTAINQPSAGAKEGIFTLLELKSDYVLNVGRIMISPYETGMGAGKLAVTFEKIRCDASGERCITTPTLPSIIEPKVIEDRRPVGGSLVLELTPEINLVVESGRHSGGLTSYTAVVRSETTRDEVKLPLNANVYTHLKK